MAYKRKRIEPQKVLLLSLDPDGETYVIVHHADGSDEMFVNEIDNESVFSWRTKTGMEVQERVPVISYLRKAARVYATMDECNILDEKGKPLFPKEKPSWEDWLQIWNSLIRPEREAIYQAVTEVNPHWGNPTSGVNI